MALSPGCRLAGARSARLEIGVLVAVGSLLAPVESQATYSIAAVDGETQQVGGAITSCVGDLDLAIVYDSVPGRGVVLTQAQLDPNQVGKSAALRWLAEGMAPAEIVSMLASAELDADFDVRQYGIVDLEGRAAGFTGSQARPYKGDRQGQAGAFTYSLQGNILTSAAVLDQAEAAFIGGGCDLADRLLRALEAGAMNGGGDSRCTPNGIPSDSAFIEVDEASGEPGRYLRIGVTATGSESAVVRLRVKYDEWRRLHPCSTGKPPRSASGCAVTAGPVREFSSGNIAAKSALIAAVALLAFTLERRRRKRRIE